MPNIINLINTNKFGLPVYKIIISNTHALFDGHVVINKARSGHFLTAYIMSDT